jgi:ketosteroid isomerase-like protein
LATLLLTQPVGADPTTCTATDHPDVAALLAARHAFNNAIATEDADAIRAVLTADVILVTGTDSTSILGRDAQVTVWQEDFDAKQRVIYVRDATCVSISPLAPIALEIGEWRGIGTELPHDQVAGRYAAKWRRMAGRWQLEAEIFSTESCSGAYCPAVEGKP